ncbi:hypothetical protein ACEPAG_4759 [Sanghuangporus baumii]
MGFLLSDPLELQTDPDGPTASVSSQIKTGIFELAEAYTHRGRRSGVAYDGLVSQSHRFLSTAIRSGNYRGIFESRETVDGLVEGVVVPNVSLRTHEVEQFEDDPLEYVRLDLSFASASSAAIAGGLTAEGTTRCQAAADVLRALVASGYETVTTEIVLRWIGLGLHEYASDPRGEDSWKRKDQSVYLLTAVATLGATAQQGVTSTNALVDVVDFFSRNRTEDPDEVLRTIDYEEQGAGYQAAYSKLAASEGLPEDPVSEVSDSRAFVGESLVSAVNREPRIRSLVQAASRGAGDAAVDAFVQSLSASGYSI